MDVQDAIDRERLEADDLAAASDALDAPHYAAFISYRHVEPDRSWAQWLHRRLEGYRVPRALRRQGVPSRLGRVFRDEDELPASADLSRSIEEALVESQFLIVVCSPRTPESAWVNREVERFRELGRGDRILALLIEGEPQQAFPAALREIRRACVDAHGQTREQLDQCEPLAADVRPVHHETRRYVRRMALWKLLACVLGCRFDDLRRRDFERRNFRWFVAAATAIVLLSVVASSVAYVATQVDAARQRVMLERDRAQRLLYSTQIERAQSEWESGDVASAWAALAACNSRLRDWEHNYLYGLFRAGQETLPVNGGPVYALAYSPDGHWLAGASWDRAIRIWDARSGEPAGFYAGHTGGVLAVAFSPDGQTLASAGLDRTVRIWDRTTGLSAAELVGHLDEVNDLAFSPDGQTLASVSDDRTVKLWDTATRQERHTLTGHRSFVQCVAFSPDGRLLASGGSEGLVVIWNAASGEIAREIRAHHAAVTSVAFSPDGLWLASGGDRGAQIYKLATGEVRLSLGDLDSDVTGLAYSPDGRRLVTSYFDSSLRVWDTDSGGELALLQGHTCPVLAVSFDPNGKNVASASLDETVKIWDVRGPRHAQRVELSGGAPGQVAFSSDRRHVIAGLNEGGLVIVEAATGKQLRRLARGAAGPESCLAASSDGRWIASALRDRSIGVYFVETGELHHTLVGHRDRVNELAFAPDGRQLASVSNDRLVRLWELDTGQPSHTALAGHTHVISGVAFSPAGQILASCSWDGTVKLWDARARRMIETLVHHEAVNDVHFSPDGKRLAAAGYDGVTLWDVATHERLAILRGHRGAVQAVTFSPDGDRLASGGADRTVRVWDVESGQELLTLRRHAAAVCGVTFSLDGQWIVSVDLGGDVATWDGSCAMPATVSR